MTIPNTARKAGPLLGTGSQTAWPFTFKVFAAGDVQVTIANSSGTETLLVLGTDYSVTLNANQETSPGGTVTYPISGSALPVGSVLAIIGDLDYDQPLDLPSGGNFSPTALENQLDRSTMQIQQLREEMNRTAKLPPTSSQSVEELVDDLQRIADSADNLDTVAENITSVNVVAADLSEPVSEINTVATSIANVNTVGNNIANVNTVAGISANVTTVAGIQANVTTVAGIAANVTAVAGNASNINAVAGNATNINAVAANETNIDAVAANEAAIDTVAGISVAVSAVAAIDDDVSTVAANVADITNFADVYLGPKTSDPTLRNDGSALQVGDLYFNTVEQALRTYGGTQWVAGTAGTMSVQNFSGNGSTTAFTLNAAPASENNTQVYIGGVYQQKDQYSVSGTTLTFSTAPTTGTNNIEVVTISTLALGETDASLVSFVQAGAGAVERTAQNKLREVVSVKDFGAVGDGATDDSAAINAALSGGNKIVYFPPGTYYILAADIVVGSNTVIEGGFATIKYGKAPARPYITRLYVSNATNVAIRNLRIDGNISAWTNNSVYTVQIYDSTDVTVTGCEIFNGIGSGVDVSQSNNQGATNKRILIDNNHIHHIGSAAIGGFYAYGNGVSVTGGQDIVIRNNNIHDIYGVSGIDLEGLLQNNIQVVGNRIWNTTGNAAGIKLYFSGVDALSNYVVIRDNILSSLSTDSSATAEPAIWIQAGGRSVSVVGNKIYSANAGGILVQNGAELLVDGNTIYNSTKAGYVINSASYIKFTNNTLVCPDGAATSAYFYIETLANTYGTCEVTGNTAINLPAPAFVLNFRSPGIFTGNTIVNCRANGTKGYAVGSDVGFARSVIGGNVIRDSLQNYSNRFFGFYNFSGSGHADMIYLPDSWYNDADAMPKYDMTSNPNYIQSSIAIRSSAPTAGTNYQGRIVYNASAAASGFVGWVCTTGGTPGTWKTFGAISA